jgi:DNA-binding NtrC family response regulator
MRISGLEALIGGSPVMHRLRERIAKAARSPLSVLIEGPTGSGKELVAAALHTESGRTGRFVGFNVCAIGDSVFEDALFGHVRGAFTGASGDSPGLLREAHQGTAFLDEVSGLQIGLQAKLLRALETGEFRPVGGRRDVCSNARIISATNEDLGALVAAQRFRPDLAHRLAGVTICVPSLAERAEDVRQLARYFLDNAGFGAMKICDGALDLLQHRAWPGNVRELKNFVEWAAVLARDELDEGTVKQAVATRWMRESPEGVAAEVLELRALLVRHNWNKPRAAEELGVHRATIYRRMQRLQIVDEA